MAPATKGTPVDGSGEIQDLQQPSMISSIIARFLWISPLRNVFMLGISPGFLTMYYQLRILNQLFKSTSSVVVNVIGNSRLTAIKSAGLPPMGKNSRFELFTKSANTLCVANRTRCPYFCSSLPRATNGWTSPLLPTTCMTMLRGMCQDFLVVLYGGGST